MAFLGQALQAVASGAQRAWVPNGFTFTDRTYEQFHLSWCPALMTQKNFIVSLPKSTLATDMPLRISVVCQKDMASNRFGDFNIVLRNIEEDTEYSMPISAVSHTDSTDKMLFIIDNAINKEPYTIQPGSYDLFVQHDSLAKDINTNILILEESEYRRFFFELWNEEIDDEWNANATDSADLLDTLFKEEIANCASISEGEIEIKSAKFQNKNIYYSRNIIRWITSLFSHAIRYITLYGLNTGTIQTIFEKTQFTIKFKGEFSKNTKLKDAYHAIERDFYLASAIQFDELVINLDMQLNNNDNNRSVCIETTTEVPLRTRATLHQLIELQGKRFGDNPYQIALKNFKAGISPSPLNLNKERFVDAKFVQGNRFPVRSLNSFVGRAEELRELARLLCVHRSVAVCSKHPVYKHGIGKTKFVEEFICHYGGHFTGGIYWLDATFPETLPHEIVGGTKTNHPARREADFTVARTDISDQLQDVLDGWSSCHRILLVFDNSNLPSEVASWLPESENVSSIIISTNDDACVKAGFEVLSLGPLSRQDSIQLLKFLCPNVTDDAFNFRKYAAIAEDLPVALKLLASMLNRSIDGRMHIFESNNSIGSEIERKNSEGGPSYLLKKILIHLEHGNAIDQMSYQILRLACCFAPSSSFLINFISASILQLSGREIDEQHFNEALDQLIALSLVERLTSSEIRVNGYFVSNFAQVMNLSKSSDYSFVYRGVLQDIETSQENGNLGELVRFQHQFLHLAESCYTSNNAYAVSIYNEIGSIRITVGDWFGAYKALMIALEKARYQLGLTDIKASEIYNNFGVVFFRMRLLKEAKLAYRKSFLILRANGRFNQVEAAFHAFNMGGIYYQEREFRQAQAQYENAIRIDEEKLGPRHPRVARDLLGLSYALAGERKTKQALAKAKRAYRILEESRGESHPETIFAEGLCRNLTSRLNSKNARAKSSNAATEAEIIPFPSLSHAVWRVAPEYMDARKESFR